MYMIKNLLYMMFAMTILIILHNILQANPDIIW